MRNEFNNNCGFIDGWNLSENCKLKLVLVPGKEGQYRLRPSSEEGQLVCRPLYSKLLIVGKNNDNFVLYDLKCYGLDIKHFGQGEVNLSW